MDEQHQPTPSKGAWRFPATVLALAVLLGIGWAVLRPDSSTVSIPVPSDPGPSDSPPSFTGSATITFSFDAGPSMPYGTAQFTVGRDNDDLDITARADGVGIGTSVSATATADDAWWHPVDKHLELALIPGYARNITSLDNGAIQAAYLAAVDVTAVTVERDPASRAEDFYWADFNGVIRNNAGDRLVSATIVAGDSPITVFEDADPAVWGYFDDNVHFVEPIARAPIGTLRVIFVEESAVPGLNRLTWVGLLPPGSTNLRVNADDAVVWGSTTLGATGRLVIAGYTENARDVEKGRTGVRSISYADAAGQHHTLKP